MKQSIFATLALLGFFNLPLSADDAKTVSPWDKDDGQWITIAGTITKVSNDSFQLVYGKGAIEVEFDGYRSTNRAYQFSEADKVIVTGRVDADKDQKRSIEAGSVYVRNLGKSYFAEADDEEEVIAKLRKATSNGTSLVVSGQLISMVKHNIVINTGYQNIQVNTRALPAGSLDSSGLLPFDIGDALTVYGVVSDGFSDAEKLTAAYIVKR